MASLLIGCGKNQNGVVEKKNLLISSGEYLSFFIHQRTVSARSQTI